MRGNKGFSYCLEYEIYIVLCLREKSQWFGCCPQCDTSAGYTKAVIFPNFHSNTRTVYKQLYTRNSAVVYIRKHGLVASWIFLVLVMSGRAVEQMVQAGLYTEFKNVKFNL